VLATLLGVLADAHRIATVNSSPPAGAGEPDPVWWVADGEGLFTADPARSGSPLRSRARGDARPWLAARAAGQAWLAEAGAILLAVGCPGDADGTRIRRSHLRAGFAAHLASLSAARLGLRCRPVGSWQQADLGAALGRPGDREWIVHGLAVGADPSPPAPR
ncbi:SagB/ThcOx family dehydrogenase, partial [Streptomyces alkaliphilus]